MATYSITLTADSLVEMRMLAARLGIELGIVASASSDTGTPPVSVSSSDVLLRAGIHPLDEWRVRFINDLNRIPDLSFEIGHAILAATLVSRQRIELLFGPLRHRLTVVEPHIVDAACFCDPQGQPLEFAQWLARLRNDTRFRRVVVGAKGIRGFGQGSLDELLKKTEDDPH